ncbi:hypothetical protein EGR_10173 [Echinococcus granulosus]|uniref:PH domain-containing protein n=1 Tax=Echinococcus granulosus TaxID=6210 RepID=W6U1K8_ECHGR|nr:hypothetical protein EGR_10173 [Echinococcus granulosus]EUB54965.1 hypothetical protein EGR_10173 [Echinococcus granulosus]
MKCRHCIYGWIPTDSEREVESWLKQLSGALEVHQRWMREHFARLVRLDLGLAIIQPVAASVTTRLKHRSALGGVKAS